MNSKIQHAKRKPSKKVNKKATIQGSIDPPQIATNLICSHRYRFAASGAYSGAITCAQVLQSLGVMGTVVNTTASLLFKCFRLKKLELWAPPPSQGSTVTISVEWLGSSNSPNREDSDTHVSVSRPAHLVCKPPPESLAKFWQVFTGTTLFNIVAPVGTIIDMSVDMIMVDQTTASSTVAAATVVLGKVYYLALDHGTSDLLVPVSLTTTV